MGYGFWVVNQVGVVSPSQHEDVRQRVVVPVISIDCAADVHDQIAEKRADRMGWFCRNGTSNKA